MMPTGKASGNAVLAKARALYGSRLRADDYRRLMACRTMTELAAALKEYPLYSEALADVNPQYARRVQLENLLRQSLYLDEDAFGYELRLQAMLSELWLAFLQQLPPLEPAAPERSSASEKVKKMMLFMTAHAAEKLSVADIAAAAYCSERECYRCFRSCLHTTPSEYLQNIRLQMASQLLLQTKLAVTDIAQRCGLGSSSYFGAQFRQHFGCSPTAYRAKWQDIDTPGHKSDSRTAASDATMEP